jgi:hypothetical protein
MSINKDPTLAVSNKWEPASLNSQNQQPETRGLILTADEERVKKPKLPKKKLLKQSPKRKRF